MRKALSFAVSRPGQFILQALLVSMSAVYGSYLAASLFLAHAGSQAIPLYYVLFAALSIPLSILFSGFIDRWSRRSIMAVLLTGHMILTPLASLTLEWGPPGWETAGCFLLYIVASIFELMLYGVFYIFFADYFTLTENKRLSGILTVALAAGALIGAGLVSLATHMVPARSAVLALPFLVLATLWHLRWLTRREDPLDECESAAEDGILESLKSLPGLSRRHPIVLAMALAMFVNIFVQCLMEYQAFSLYTAAFPGEGALTSFIALMGAVVEVVGVVLVFCVSEPLIPRLGVARMNMIAPLVNVASFAVLAVAPGLASGILAHINYSPLEHSLNAPLFALVYNAVPYRFSGRVRVINDGVVYPLALAASGGLLLLVQRGMSLPQVALIGLGASLLYALSQWSVGRQYVRSLMEMLRSGAVELDRVGRGLRLPEDYADDLKAMIAGGQADDMAMALELAVRCGLALPPAEVERVLARIPATEARRILEGWAERDGAITALAADLTESANAAVRARILEALAGRDEAVAAAMAERLRQDGDETVRAVACAMTAPQNLPSHLGEEAALAALYVLRRRGVAEIPPALSGHGSAKVRAEALTRLALGGRAGDSDNQALARRSMTDEDAAVRAAAAALTLTGAPDLHLPALSLPGLGDSCADVRRAAALALGGRGDVGLEILADRLSRAGLGDTAEAALLMEGIGAAGARIADPILFLWLSRKLFPAVARDMEAIKALPAGRGGWALLRTALSDEIASAVQLVLHALSVLGYKRVLNLVRVALRDGDGRARANALETLASLDHRHYAMPLMPYLEAHGDLTGQQGFDAQTAQSLLTGLLPQSGAFIQAAALTVWRNEFGGLPDVDPRILSPLAVQTLRALSAAMPSGPYDEDAPMNRLAFLKSVPLFSEMTLDQLMAVDGAMERESFLPGETIVTEGDLGDKLYLLAQGAVSVHKAMPDGGQRELARLAPGQLFGEMALFDDDRRSATVTALEETGLLSLTQQRFHSLARQRPEIPMQICKVLVGRLRQAIA